MECIACLQPFPGLAVEYFVESVSSFSAPPITGVDATEALASDMKEIAVLSERRLSMGYRSAIPGYQRLRIVRLPEICHGYLTPRISPALLQDSIEIAMRRLFRITIGFHAGR
ncbi:hypothetical protein HS99_0031300 [Kitasatospora aureofaciens]|uniref:Uncharacterized protein n=1 Tax=Kitasatospora aureofaciens TaxID=1894 RepID=A0A1E7N631_KITAU|nr:hypothetical protein B6264_15280 [Kitasatospora aureofaciens]OEV36151.1 hypothetical protein HS99_0031300 [Kitasatospora aureofaciens]